METGHIEHLPSGDYRATVHAGNVLITGKGYLFEPCTSQVDALTA